MTTQQEQIVQTAAPLNLFQKLVEIRKNIPVIHKDAKGYNNNYQYVTGSQLLIAIKDTMNHYGVLLFPKIITRDHTTRQYKSYKGKELTEYTVFGEMSYTWMNADNPEETLEIPFAYAGSQDDMARAFGSALTYAERYFLIKFFNIPTDNEDPDGRNYNNYREQQNYQQQNYRQAPPQQQQRQQPQQNNQQAAPQTNKDGEKLMTQQQRERILKALAVIAGENGDDQKVAFESACVASNISENKQFNDLVFTEAEAIIFYLAGLYKERQAQGKN